MSTGALLLARLHDREQLVPAAEFLEHSDAVECWSAVDGHVDLVAKLKAQPSELLSQIRALGGEQELEVIELANSSGTFLCGSSICYSCVFLEVEGARLEAVRDQLAALQEVMFCSLRAGTSELIAIVSGNSFQAIDRSIAERIRPLDGVLRLKQDRVINLKQI